MEYCEESLCWVEIVDGADAKDGTPAFKYDREENGLGRWAESDRNMRATSEKNAVLTKGGSFKRKVCEASQG